MSYIIGCDKDMAIKRFKRYDLPPVEYYVQGEVNSRSYRPDFIVDDKIIEVKRSFNRLLPEAKIIVENKAKYAKAKFGDAYKIVFEEEVESKYGNIHKFANLEKMTIGYDITFYNI